MSLKPRQPDVYTAWLGLPESPRPVDYYMLLHVGPYGCDVASLPERADRQLDKLEKYALSPDRATREKCQDLMDEVAAALTTLTDPAKKAAYDASLNDRYPLLASRRPAAAGGEGRPQDGRGADPVRRGRGEAAPRSAEPEVGQGDAREVDLAAVARVRQRLAARGLVPPAPAQPAPAEAGPRSPRHITRTQAAIAAACALVGIAALLLLMNRDGADVDEPANPVGPVAVVPPDPPVTPPKGADPAPPVVGPVNPATDGAAKDGAPQVPTPPPEPPKALTADPPLPAPPQMSEHSQLVRGQQQRWTVVQFPETKIILIHLDEGSFEMGTPDGPEQDRRHPVKISKPFAIGTTEVTQAQWVAVMGTRPWLGLETTISDSAPAVNISWHDANHFCDRLSRLKGQRFRLPTEAEWEYACRAGSTTAFSHGDNETDLSKFAWYRGGEAFQPVMHVAQKQPNRWGLYDMHGNVAEWTATVRAAYPYAADDGRNSRVVPPAMPSNRVLRGGASFAPAAHCRSDTRLHGATTYKAPMVGFRVALELRNDVEIHLTDHRLEVRFSHGVTIPMLRVSDESTGPGDASATEPKLDPYFLGDTEITRAQWLAVMGTAPWKVGDAETDEALPANHVSFQEAERFCQILSQRTKQRFRLPTGAELSLARRAGQPVEPAARLERAELQEFAHFGSKKGPARVASKKPNSWGFYDLYGNVREWAGASSAEARPVGGAFSDSTRRFPEPESLAADQASATVGFRLVMVPTAEGTASIEAAVRPVAADAKIEVKTMDVEVNKDIAITMVLVGGGKPLAIKKGRETVEVKPFYLGQTEVTRGQWQAVMGTRPWGAEGPGSSDARPANFVSHSDALKFCQLLGAKTGKRVRLPTKDEWNVACWAGAERMIYDDVMRTADRVAWYSRSVSKYSPPFQVATKRCNDWGFFDMYGNVSEWCAEVDSSVAEALGGAYNDNSGHLIMPKRRHPDDRSGDVGFRVALDLPTETTAPPKATGAVTPTAPEPKAELKKADIEIKKGISITMLLVTGDTPDAKKVGIYTNREWVEVKPFYLGQTEVTRGQWFAVMGTKPWKQEGKADDALPVNFVDQNEAQRFCQAMSTRTGKRFSLPSSTEWQIACRAGSDEPRVDVFAKAVDEIAWHGKHTSPFAVATRKANAWGFYDLYGNVSEWCSTTDSRYAEIVGGSYAARVMRSNETRKEFVDRRYETIGFRVRMEAD